MKQFSNLYQVVKTLRFELQPIGRTKENIEKNGILERDNLRANNYKSIKKVIDEYHKAFIEQILGNFIDELDDKERIVWQEALNDYYFIYHLQSSDPKRKERLISVQETLRKQISSLFTKNDKYKRLFGKELVRVDLSEFVYTPVFEAYLRKQKANESLNDEEICEIQDNLVKDIDTFRNFTTYFSGFYENRKNLYTSDDKATSIAHRIIGENLPKFVDNMGVFAKIEDSEISTHFGELFKAMEPWLNVLAINEMFKLDYFQMVLTQKQIDVYNSIIGGRTLEDGSKIRGLNEYINLYNQKQKDKGSRLPKLKPLFKQILSERNAISWLPDEFESDNHMLESIKICYQDLNNHVFESLKGLLKSLNTFDLEHIFLPNDLQLTEISQKHYGSWSLIKSVVLDSLKAIYSQKRNENVDEYEKRLNKLYDSFSIADINNLLQNKIEVFEPIEEYFAQMGAEDDENGQKPNLFIRIETAHNEVASLLRLPYPEGKSLSQDKVSVEKIKKLLDAIKDLQHFVKPLLGKGTESEKDNNFYGEFVPLWEMLDKITPLYNMVRNRMLRKPYSDEKIKLYFENNGSFLNVNFA